MCAATGATSKPPHRARTSANWRPLLDRTIAFERSLGKL